MKPVALTIASSDSSNGAGVSLDLRVFEKFGVYGTMAIATCTAQNSFGVQRIYKIAPRIIEAQIDAIVKDFPVKACKVGMLYSPEIVNTVAKRIKRRNIPNIILDIPIISKNGVVITKESAYKSIVKNLIPQAFLITPNIPEAEKLSGIEIKNREDMENACKMIRDLGAKNVLLKGGHSEKPFDLFYDGECFYEFEGEKYFGKNTHGTGCFLSAGICAGVASGKSLGDSISEAKRFINEIIPQSQRLGKGDMDFITFSGLPNSKGLVKNL